MGMCLAGDCGSAQRRVQPLPDSNTCGLLEILNRDTQGAVSSCNGGRPRVGGLRSPLGGVRPHRPVSRVRGGLPSNARVAPGGRAAGHGEQKTAIRARH